MTTKEFIDHEAESDLNNPYQPFTEKLIKFSYICSGRG